MKVWNLKYGLGGDVHFAAYGTGETALRIFERGEFIATATINIEEWGAPPADRGRLWVKTWAENEGMDAALIDSGVCLPFSELCGDAEFYGGHEASCRAVLLRLSPAAMAELEVQGG